MGWLKPIIKCGKCGSTNYGYTDDMRLLCRNCGHTDGKREDVWKQSESSGTKTYSHVAEKVHEF